VAMAEIAGSMREGLLALAVGTGLQVMQVLMEADVTAAAGPKGRHDPGRTAVRHGYERGSVTLGGRRVLVSRPRVRAADGAREVPVPNYELFSSTEILGAMAMERMLAGLSTRRYRSAWSRSAPQGRRWVLESFPSCPVPEIARLGRTLKKWREAFLAYSTPAGAATAAPKAINGLNELYRRVARSFRNRDKYRLRVPGDRGGLTSLHLKQVELGDGAGQCGLHVQSSSIETRG
jgi:hypothetical protein